MRPARIALAICGLVPGLWGADPFVGTWKLNPARCAYTAGQPMKEQTITITESGSDLEVQVQGISASGEPTRSHYTVPVAGGEGKIIQSTYEAVSAKRLGAKERQTNFSQGGKLVFSVRTVLSVDGKTLSAHVKGTDPAGKSVAGVSVFDRQ